MRRAKEYTGEEAFRGLIAHGYYSLQDAEQAPEEVEREIHAIQRNFTRYIDRLEAQAWRKGYNASRVDSVTKNVTSYTVQG